MKLRNSSGFPAALLVGSTGEFEQLAIVVCKISYAMDGRGGLAPAAAESAWPVFRESVMVNGVILGSELDYQKRGIDILVFGEAVAPRREKVASMKVEVRCGPVAKSIDVIGDRKWVRNGLSIRRLLGGEGSYSISDPEPFLSMPLSNDRAFGGTPKLGDDDCPHPVNGAGRGYVREGTQVEGTPLPNLERPDQRIRHWRDNPIPACMFKPTGLLLDAAGPCSLQGFGEGADSTEVLRRIAPRMFQQTVPDLVCSEGKLGRALTLDGFDPQGKVRFPLPAERSAPGVRGPYVRAAIGGKRSRFPLQVVTIAAFMPQRALVVTYRGLFRYLFVPEELRAAELVFSGNPYLEPASGD